MTIVGPAFSLKLVGPWTVLGRKNESGPNTTWSTPTCAKHRAGTSGWLAANASTECCTPITAAGDSPTVSAIPPALTATRPRAPSSPAIRHQRLAHDALGHSIRGCRAATLTASGPRLLIGIDARRLHLARTPWLPQVADLQSSRQATSRVRDGRYDAGGASKTFTPRHLSQV